MRTADRLSPFIPGCTCEGSFVDMLKIDIRAEAGQRDELS